MRSRFALTATDQAVYSAGTLVLQFGVLRAADASGLATFGVLYAGFWLVAGTARALFGESQLVVRARGRAGDGAAPHPRHVLAYCLVTLAVGLAATGLFSDGERSQALAMALSIPAVTVTDVVRYTLLAEGRPGRALLLDAIWLALQVTMTIWVIASAQESPAWIIAAWGAGAAIAVLSCAPRLIFRGGGSRSEERSRIGKGMAVEFMLTSGIQQMLPFVLFGAGATIPLAALRAAQTIVAPINLIFTVGTTMSYSYLASPSSPGPRKVGAALAGSVVLAVLVCGTALYSIPGGLRDAVIGQNWEIAQLILLPVLVQVALNGIASGGIIASRLLRSPRANLVRRTWTVPGLVVAPLFGVWIADALGLGVGLAVGTAMGAVIWWVGLPRPPA